MSTPNRGLVAFAVGICVRPLPTETESGDACSAVPWSRGVAVVLADGLGHGPRAGAAAKAFVDCVRESVELPLEEIFARGHRMLLKTRGAVATVARFDEEGGRVEIGAIGNVAAQIVRTGDRRSDHPIAVAGVLGSAYRSVRPQEMPFGVGDMFVMCSDGVRSRIDVDLIRMLGVQAAAESIVKTNGKGTDDASCAVVQGIAATPSPNKDTGDRVIPIRIRGDAECAAHEARTFARRVGLGARAEWEVSIATSELATNVLKFAGAGEVRLRHVQVPREGVVVEAVDRGRGITDVSAAIVDGYTEQPEHGLGVGLGSVHRLMDHVSIQTDHLRGTRVVAAKFRG